MLEGHDRRHRRHLRRAPEDLGAVDDVAPHDLELGVGQLVGLVEDLGRRAHLADVVHQSGDAELAQQRAVDAERARLRHRQDRHVHHVRERVVVVVLQRRQRDERRCGSAPRPAPACPPCRAPRRDRDGPRPPTAATAARRRSRPRCRSRGWPPCRPATCRRAARPGCGRPGCGRSGWQGQVPRRRSPDGRRSPANAPTSVAISSAVTSRSMTMRSTPSRCSRRIRSPIVPLERGRGTSPTTNSPPTTPSVSDRCWPMTSGERFEKRVDVAARPADGPAA